MRLALLYTELRVRDTKFKTALKGAKALTKSVSKSMDRMKRSLQFNSLAALDKKFTASMAKRKRAVEGFTNALHGMARAAKYAVAAVTGFAAISIRNLIKQQFAEKKLEAILRATGEAAGFSAGELKARAKALERMTNYSDAAVINTQALLATFLEIKGVNFSDAIDIILDISDVMGQDLKASAIQVGKALNDPTVGITALRRIGISFNQTQIKTVQGLMEANDLYGAQRVILDELKEEMGGAAAAAKTSLGGALKTLYNEVVNLSEAVGRELEPSVRRLTLAIRKNIPWMEQWVKANGKTAVVVVGLTTALAGLTIASAGVVTVVKVLLPIMPALGAAMLAAFPVALAAGVGLLFYEFGKGIGIALRLERVFLRLGKLMEDLFPLSASGWGDTDMDGTTLIDASELERRAKLRKKELAEEKRMASLQKAKAPPTQEEREKTQEKRLADLRREGDLISDNATIELMGLREAYRLKRITVEAFEKKRLALLVREADIRSKIADEELRLGMIQDDDAAQADAEHNADRSRLRFLKDELRVEQEMAKERERLADEAARAARDAATERARTQLDAQRGALGAAQANLRGAEERQRKAQPRFEGLQQFARAIQVSLVGGKESTAVKTAKEALAVAKEQVEIAKKQLEVAQEPPDPVVK